MDITEVTHSFMTVEWDAPFNNGGAAIKGYVVQRRQGVSSRFIPISKGLVHDTFFRDHNVFGGMDYEYRVAAENEAGEGAFSKPTPVVVAKDPFGEFMPQE